MKIEGNVLENNEVEVYVNGKHLDPRPSQKVFNHSPDGFQWGYGGSGPAQLALAIPMTVTDPRTAVKLHQAFKWDYIAPLPFLADFEIKVDIEAWLQERS